ncbi:casein kinase beta subunit 1-1 [Stylonychia lemnae]|uniref:Casein kinase II subunit beta n=1 Tax=Stylonychia lemnae TaxID=5949 RepID=A0A078AUY3_STYLE|nr:casein kinase beta subunit 1-1 [Stylonychia lemnae]|eukprot:CDW84678.1 casein kinase beta subunit 1-1 [Stylonychia lemnae]
MSEDESQQEQVEQISWIEWHCSIDGHEFLCQVDHQFIRDNFNQSGLKKQFKNYNEALNMILEESPEPKDLEKELFSVVYQQAFDLYGLIHARFIQTPRGLQMMRQKFQDRIFGTCPRVQCGIQPVLPIGLSDELSVSKVKIFCPKCEDVFVPKGQRSAHATNTKGCRLNLDGAYFGTSFPSIFLMNSLKDVPELGPQPFIPTIYGFRIHGLSQNANLRGNQAQNHNLNYQQERLQQMGSPQVVPKKKISQKSIERD